MLIVPLLLGAFAGAIQDVDAAAPELQPEHLEAAARVAGLEFSEEEIKLMLSEVRERLAAYDGLRERDQPNAWIPAESFSPLQPGIAPVLHEFPSEGGVATSEVVRPESEAELCLLSIPELGTLLRNGELNCVELAEIYLDRLEQLDEVLHCVISLTRERALAQAAERDAELARGVDRGPLHGIPWGAKDLLAVAGTRTTWGAAPFSEQVLDETASVVKRLDEAGAVLIAKLSLGALAMGDVWFDGRTRNPWNTSQGSSGSSAGPASAVVSGGVGFAIGSETLGSIVSPSVRCGVSSLRPTFGRVPRTGAMTLSWTMDKLGPMCRNAAGAALVLQAISGPDGADPTALDQPLPDCSGLSLEGLRCGVPAGLRRTGALGQVLAQLEAMGVELVEISLPDYPVGAMLITLTAEAATAFDELTRSGQDDELTRQVRSAWPTTFRAARLIPAVEYLRAQRLRSQLCVDLSKVLESVDFLVHSPFGAGLLSMTNLTGQPTFVAPVFTSELGAPDAICFTGRLFDDAFILAIAQRWQEAAGHPLRHPRPLLKASEAGR